MLLVAVGLLAWVPQPAPRYAEQGVRRLAVHGPRCEYGDEFYGGAYELLPDGVFEVAIRKPLGIGFEEDGPIVGKSGVSVNALVEGGNAAKGVSVWTNVAGKNEVKEGKVQVGDKLVGVTAIQYSAWLGGRTVASCVAPPVALLT